MRCRHRQHHFSIHDGNVHDDMVRCQLFTEAQTLAEGVITNVRSFPRRLPRGMLLNLHTLLRCFVPLGRWISKGGSTNLLASESAILRNLTAHTRTHGFAARCTRRMPWCTCRCPSGDSDWRSGDSDWIIFLALYGCADEALGSASQSPSNHAFRAVPAIRVGSTAAVRMFAFCGGVVLCTAGLDYTA